MKRELSGGSVHEVEPKPDAAALGRIEQGRIWIAEIHLFETVIHHTREKLGGLGTAFGVIQVVYLQIGNGFRLHKVG